MPTVPARPAVGEQATCQAGQPKNVIEFAIISKERVTIRHTQDLIVGQTLVFHLEQANRPGLDDTAGKGRLVEAGVGSGAVISPNVTMTLSNVPPYAFFYR